MRVGWKIKNEKSKKERNEWEKRKKERKKEKRKERSGRGMVRIGREKENDKKRWEWAGK